MVYLRKLISNIFFLKYFVINYVLSFMYLYNAQWKISPKWKYCDFVHGINCTHKFAWVCACACACHCTHLMEQYVGILESDIRKRQKKNHIHFTTNIFTLYGSQAYWSFLKLYFVHTVKVYFVFNKQLLCLYSSVYV